MFLKYTNTSVRTSILGLLQSRSWLGGSLLSECSLKARFKCSPSIKRYGPSFYNTCSTTHKLVTHSQSEGTGTMLTALILAKGQYSSFIYVFVKGSFGPRVLSSVSHQFPLRAGLPFQLNYFDDNVSFKMIICLKFKLIKVTYPIKNILGSRTTF